MMLALADTVLFEMRTNAWLIVHESLSRFYDSRFPSKKSCLFCDTPWSSINNTMCQSPWEFCVVLFSVRRSIKAFFQFTNIWASVLRPQCSLDIKSTIVTGRIGSSCTTWFSTGSLQNGTLAWMISSTFHQSRSASHHLHLMFHQFHCFSILKQFALCV